MSKTNGNTQQRPARLAEKRRTTMPDGRYLIYYTFPSIDTEFDKLRDSERAPSSSRPSEPPRNA